MAKDKPSGIGVTILKTIGIITAVISVVLGGRQIVNMIQDNAAKKAKAAELNLLAQNYASSGDYSRAWQSISQAVQLLPEYRYEQAEIAMTWLRDIRINVAAGQRNFSDVVDKVLPVLYGAIDTSKKEYSAKILAHIGWSNYLRFRDGEEKPNVEEQYLKALKLDSTNLYAHAMYGHWILYPTGHTSGSIDEANRHFALALKNGKDTKYVHDLMLAAFRNRDGIEYEAQVIKIANDMRKSGEAIALSQRERILSYAYYRYRNEFIEGVGKLIRPKDHLDTFLYLTEGMDISKKRYLEVAWVQLKNGVRE